VWPKKGGWLMDKVVKLSLIILLGAPACASSTAPSEHSDHPTNCNADNFTYAEGAKTLSLEEKKNWKIF